MGAWLVVAQYIYLAMAVAGAIWLIGYIIHLSFGRFVLKETRDPASLKHAAEFTRSYRSANFKSIADVIAKLAGRGPRSLKLRQAVQHCGSALGSHATTEVHVLRDLRASMAELVGDLPGAQSSPIEQCCSSYLTSIGRPAPAPCHSI